MNPFEAIYWNQVETLVWVFTRDEGAVRLVTDQVGTDNAHGADLPGDEVPSDVEVIGLAVINRIKACDLPFESVDEAENAVVEALTNERAGKLGVWGYRNGTGDRDEIPDSEVGTADLRFYWDDPKYGSHLGPRDRSRPDATRWTGLIFKRKEVLTHWPPLGRPGVSRDELRRWLAEHHVQRESSGLPPTERDDFDEARKQFPGVSRSVVRQERQAILSPGQLRPGRRTGSSPQAARAKPP